MNKLPAWGYHHLKIMIIYYTVPDRCMMVHDRFNCYFSFWAIFCPFTPLTDQKIKIWKKMKSWEISSFYTSAPKIMIMCYTVPEIWHMTHVIGIFHFGLFFALLTPLNGNMLMISPLSWIEPIPSSSKEEKVLVLLK